MVDRARADQRFQTRLITVVDRNNRIISTSDPDFYRGESLSNYLEKENLVRRFVRYFRRG